MSLKCRFHEDGEMLPALEYLLSFNENATDMSLLR